MDPVESGALCLFDHTGTRRIEPDHARMIIDAPPGADPYRSDLTLELDLQAS